MKFGRIWGILWSDVSIDLKNLRHISLRLSLSVGNCEQTNASLYDNHGKIMRIARICILWMSSVRYWVSPGCHAAHAYSSTDRILVVYMSSISFEGIPAQRHNTNKCSRCEALPEMYSTCWFHLRSSLIIIPRIFDWLTTSIGELPIYKCLKDLLDLLKSIRSSSVFVALMIMSFWLDHVWALLALFCNVSEVGSLLICMMFVSSTHFEYWRSNSRSFICTTNKITSKRVPWGAPPHSWSKLDCDPPILTCSCQAVRKAAIQRSKSAGVPISDSFWKTIWWLIRSKALE